MRGRKPPERLRVLVLADANTRTGLGHLMRTRALVEALGECRPVETLYVGRFDSRESAWIRQWGYRIRGSRDRRRARILRKCLQEFRPHIAIFDAYRRLETELRLTQSAGACTVLFDDRRTVGTAPVTIRVNALEGPGRVPPRQAIRHLVGLRYVCVRPEIVKRARRARKPEASTCIVSLGGGRTPRLRPLVSRLKSEVPMRRWIVLRSGPARRAYSVTGTARGSDTRSTQIVSHPADVAAALARATVAVSAAGTTAWELACLGVPAVLWPMVPNQQAIARALDHRTCHSCSHWRDIPRALAELIADPVRLRRLSQDARKLIDGLGARRLATAVLTLVHPR